jgi:hypothetical protein
MADEDGGGRDLNATIHGNQRRALSVVPQR